MRTIHDAGWLVETGPNSALETTPLFGEMFEGLGILEERLYAEPAADRRYILRGGILHPLPMSPRAFLASSLWTFRGKARLLKEPFIGRSGREETIAEFVERRLGREFLDYAINPFVAGVYAGNPEQLSVRAAFPRLYALEEKYGGLIKGMILGARDRKKRAEKAKDRARMFSFRNGMETFPLAAARSLGDRLWRESSVEEIACLPDGRFRVRARRKGAPAELSADAVVIAVPAHAAGRLVRPLSAAAADILSRIYYPPVAECSWGSPLRQ